MKVKFIDAKGRLVKESDVKSMNHYQMLLKGLKASKYSLFYAQGGETHTRHITVK